MNRSEFLKKSLIGSTLIPSFINGFSVKAMGAEFALAAALNAPTTLNDNVLVIIQLNGGNDGLNTVIPLEYFSNYVNARQNIFIPEDKVLALNPDKKVGLHPSLTGLQSLYKNGQLKVIGLKLCNQYGNPIQLRRVAFGRENANRRRCLERGVHLLGVCAEPADTHGNAPGCLCRLRILRRHGDCDRCAGIRGRSAGRGGRGLHHRR